ncbi:AraC family transcriptional regulator [Verrucomicrobiota bacterium]
MPGDTVGDTPIIDVAAACGFRSLSHFYHVFKSHTGVTPRQARFKR